MTRTCLAAMALLGISCGGTESQRVYSLPAVCAGEVLASDADRCAGWLVDELMTARLGVYEDPELLAYVESVGETVAEQTGRSDLPFTFRILDDPGVQAWAAPDAHVYVTRGLLAQLGSEAELAAILGHEIGHVAAGHTDGMLDGLPEPTATSGDWGGRFHFDRDDEAQADQLSVLYMRRAGYDPGATASMLAAIHRGVPADEPSWLDRHPPLPVRLALTSRAAPDAGEGRLARAQYLRRTADMVVGRDPRHGRVDGRRYVHERGGFSFLIPEGLTHEDWRPGTIRSQWFRAVGDGGRAGMMLTTLSSPRGELLAELLEAELLPRARRTTLAGYDALEATLSPGETTKVRFEGASGSVRALLFEGRDGHRYGLFVTADGDGAAALYRDLTRSFRTTEQTSAPRLLRDARREER